MKDEKLSISHRKSLLKGRLRSGALHNGVRNERHGRLRREANQLLAQDGALRSQRRVHFAAVAAFQRSTTDAMTVLSFFRKVGTGSFENRHR